MIIFGSLLTSFEVSNIFRDIWTNSKNWLKLKMKPSKEVEIVQISDAQGISEK